MKKNRILHIISRVQRGGGAENNMLLTIRGLIRNGYDVALLVGDDSDIDYAKKSAGCLVAREPYLIRNINPIKDLLAFYRIYKFIRSGDFAIVHTHLAKAGILGRLAAWLVGTPIIIHSLHGITFHNGLNVFSKNIYLFFEKIAGKLTDVFISVGDDLKNRYIGANIGNPEKYFVVRSGINFEKFYDLDNLSEKEINNFKKRFKLSKKDVVIGMVATLERRKGHEYAIEAARKLVNGNPNIKFIFAGDGCLKNYLLALAQKYKLDGNIIFTGYVKDIEKIFAVCNVIILTSLWEGLPQVLVQAAASGKPIVSFDVEGAKEIISNGVNGFIVHIKDVDALVDRIKYLISNPERAMLIGEQGRALIGDEWKIEDMINKTLDIYESQLNANKLLS